MSERKNDTPGSVGPQQRLAYPLKEAAHLYSTSYDTLQRARRAGELRTFRAGAGDKGKIMVTACALEEWIKKREDDEYRKLPRL